MIRHVSGIKKVCGVGWKFFRLYFWSWHQLFRNFCSCSFWANLNFSSLPCQPHAHWYFIHDVGDLILKFENNWSSYVVMYVSMGRVLVIASSISQKFLDSNYNDLTVAQYSDSHQPIGVHLCIPIDRPSIRNSVWFIELRIATRARVLGLTTRVASQLNGHDIQLNIYPHRINNTVRVARVRVIYSSHACVLRTYHTS